MSEFDIFFDEYENKHNCSPEKYECFEAGAQSKQAEIDELRKKYDNLYKAFTYADDCRKEWHESYMCLKSRIIEALDMLEGRQGKVLLDDIVDILKGTTNDH